MSSEAEQLMSAANIRRNSVDHSQRVDALQTIMRLAVWGRTVAIRQSAERHLNEYEKISLLSADTQPRALNGEPA